MRVDLSRALEREAATREVLQAISASRTDPAPVFDVILRNAALLSGAPLANLCLLDNSRTHWRLVAHFGDGLRHLSVGGTATPLDSRLAPAVSIRTGRVVQIEDLKQTDLYEQGDPGRVAMVDIEGMRTILCVPLLSENAAVGCITLFRRKIEAFTRLEIELVETFSAQAVIAVENSRQFQAVQQRLARERSTREVLEIISRSREDEQPVFRAILDRAQRLCNAQTSGLQLLNETGSHIEVVATCGRDGGHFPAGERLPMSAKTLVAQSIREARVVHVEDTRETEGYKSREKLAVLSVEGDGVLTRLVVPLMRDDRAIGTMTLSRLEQRSFSDDEIALLETFAAQAVIAIENVRQFKALEALNAELGERVEAQVDEIERMGRLKRFLPLAVADTIVSSGSENILKSHRALLGVLFCDIRGFTAFCETAEPEETIEVLQTYHEEMGKLINAHGAGVDHRIGDGIMVLFNDPLPCEDPASEALRLAVSMRERMSDLCRTWKRTGYHLGFGVGVSFGYATVGIVGFESRSDYTASGTAINVAARLCDMAEDGDILLSARAAIAVEGKHASVSIGKVTLKGIREPVEVFRLSAATDQYAAGRTV